MHAELADIGLAEDHAHDHLRRHDLPRRGHLQHRRHVVARASAPRSASAILAGNGKYHDDPLVNDIKIKISGCPNSCGQHHVADIGFYGMAVRMGDRQVPAFQLMLGGNAQGEGRLATVTMKIPARYAPDAMEKLIDTYVAERNDGEIFRSWNDRVGKAHIQEVLAEYKIVPEFTKDPMAYVDWGQTKFFTLDDMGEGECAV